MLENRSYDNVLGWLYNPSNNAPYNQAPPGQSDLQGLSGTESNPDPLNPGATITVSNPTSQTVGGSGQQYPGTAVPLIDPGELFGDMAQQFLGTATYPAGAAAQMQGFTANYLNALLNSSAAPVSNLAQNNLQDVMTYLTPQQLPVTAFLANNFAVCDEWFASVPSQTYVNRVFALCAAPAIVQAVAASGGLPAINYSVVDDPDFPVDLPTHLLPKWPLLTMPTVCDQLDLVLGGAAVNWKIYFHDYSIAVMTMQSIAAAATSAKNQNVSTFDNLDWGSDVPKQLTVVPTTFVDDVTNTNGGVLPPFSFIEPRYSSTYATNDYPPNSNHPGASEFGIGKTVDPSDPPIDATGGELLLMQVYNLLRNSQYWESTLLIITYDEHGGVYDHYFPPAATPRGTLNAATPPLVVPPASPSLVGKIEDSRDTAALGFGYTLFGGRVPAILVSPYLAAGSTVRSDDAVFDHSSIVKPCGRSSDSRRLRRW
jgi:phospholipase C